MKHCPGALAVATNDRRPCAAWFEEKLVDVVGLYLNPPENAIVLRMDAKSQIQASDRTQRFLKFLRTIDRAVPKGLRRAHEFQ